MGILKCLSKPSVEVIILSFMISLYSFAVSDVINPCTVETIERGKLHHPHPFDKSMYIKCDFLGALYITKCPRGDEYYDATETCGLDTRTYIRGDKTPLDTTLENPCNVELLRKDQFYFRHPLIKELYIQCDVWGNAWVKTCGVNEVWDQEQSECVWDPSNPCTTDALLAGIVTFPFPDSKYRYIHCNSDQSSEVKFCYPGLVYEEEAGECVRDDRGMLKMSPH